jgi:polyhydroxybutyrate depolymerase
MQPGCVPTWACGRPIAATAAALLLAAAIAGCGNHGAAANAGTLRPASGTSGCGHHEASGSLQYNLTVSGHQRMVTVHIPAGYTSKSKLALVLNLHGSESTASAQEQFSGMDATADADHFIVAYPQALIPDGTGYDWNIPGEPMVNGKYPPASAPSDVTFLTTLVRDLEGRYCVDLSRPSGHSWPSPVIAYSSTCVLPEQPV